MSTTLSTLPRLQRLDYLNGDEQFLFELLAESSRRFRNGKSERTGVFFYFVSRFYGWSSERFNEAFDGLVAKGRIAKSNQGVHIPGRRRNQVPKAITRVSKSIRAQVFARWPNCAYCRRRMTLQTMTLDHLIPKSRGGSDDIENLVGCCETCNMAKGSMLVHEWASQILNFHRPHERRSFLLVRALVQCQIFLAAALSLIVRVVR